MWEKDLWKEMREMQNRMDNLFRKFEPLSKEFNTNKSLERYREAITDFKEQDKNFIINIEIPGVRKEDITLDTTDESLIVKAKRKQEKESKGKKGEYFFAKSYAGFYQEIPLPKNADKDKITATYTDGILKVTLPKKKVKITKKRIKVD